MSRYLNKQLAIEARRGRLDRVEVLLAKGADINKLAPNGFTPLMSAAYAGHFDLVQAILQHGADPNATDKDGASALFWACVRGHEPVTNLLIAAGADVNAVRDRDYSVLNAAISCQGSLALVKSLVKAGASLDHRWLQYDMLQYAEWCERQDLIPFLKSKG